MTARRSTTVRRRRPAPRRRISIRFLLVVVALFAFPWALPLLILMALGILTMLACLAAALMYAAALFVQAHTTPVLAVVALATLAGAHSYVTSATKRWATLRVAR